MATAIAHFTYPPNRRVSVTEQVGVVAFHKNDIQHVAFSINGGAATNVTTRTKVTNTDVKGKTVTHWEYQIEFNPSLYSDGAVTFDATAVPVSGTSRVLTQITLHANSGGTLDGNIIYLTNASNPGGTGTSGNPYDTPKAALTASDVNGGDIIELMVEGTYLFDVSLSQLASRRTNLDFWTTIRGAAGLNHHNVIIGHTTRDICRLEYDRIKWEHLTFDPDQISQLYPGETGYDLVPDRIGDTHWFEDVYMNDAGGWANPGVYDGTFFRSSIFNDGVYVTNSEAFDVVFGFAGSRFQRNSYQKRVSSDVYKGDQCVLNCSVNEMVGTIRTLIDGAHADLCQIINTNDNVLFYNVECTDLIDVQGIHFDETGGSFSNVAFINYSALTDNSVLISSILGAHNHTLMHNVSIPNQGITLRDNDVGQPFSAVDFDIRNSIFKYITSDSGPQLTGTAANNCHTVTAANTWGINNTLGDVNASDVGIIGNWEYIGADLADITESGEILPDISFPNWAYSSATTPNKGAWPQSAWQAILLTGTLANSTEVDIVTGGKTTIVTLNEDTWIAAGTGAIGTTAQTASIVAGMVSAQAELLGWNNEVTGTLVRTSDTVATITWTASVNYDITAEEVLTLTVPADVLVTSVVAVEAVPTTTIGFTDETAPVLITPTGTTTSDTTANGTVTTNEGNGTLYFLASINATELEAAIRAGSSQAVNVSGEQPVSFTGLSPSTTYYPHYIQEDAAANVSNIASSASFTTGASTVPSLFDPTHEVVINATSLLSFDVIGASGEPYDDATESYWTPDTTNGVIAYAKETINGVTQLARQDIDEAGITYQAPVTGLDPDTNPWWFMMSYNVIAAPSGSGKAIFQLANTIRDGSACFNMYSQNTTQFQHWIAGAARFLATPINVGTQHFVIYKYDGVNAHDYYDSEYGSWRTLAAAPGTNGDTLSGFWLGTGWNAELPASFEYLVGAVGYAPSMTVMESLVLDPYQVFLSDGGANGSPVYGKGGTPSGSPVYGLGGTESGSKVYTP